MRAAEFPRVGWGLDRVSGSHGCLGGLWQCRKGRLCQKLQLYLVFYALVDGAVLRKQGVTGREKEMASLSTAPVGSAEGSIVNSAVGWDGRSPVTTGAVSAQPDNNFHGTVINYYAPTPSS